MSHNARYIVQVVLYISRLYDGVRRGYTTSGVRLRGKFKANQSGFRIVIGDRAVAFSDCAEPRHHRSTGALGTGHASEEPRPARARSLKISAPEDKDRPDTCGDPQCPIPDMGPRLRLYERLTMVMGTVILLKYVILCLASVGWIDEAYKCYVPGRADVVGRFIRAWPVCALYIVASYLSWRVFAHWAYRELDLDCFPFLMCTEEQVRHKERLLDRLNRWPPRDSQAAAEIFVANRMFYRQVLKSDGRTEYAMRPHRTAGQLRALSKFVGDQFRGQLAALAVLGGLYLWNMVDMASDEAFNLSYGGCHVFASRGHMDAATNTYRWSLRDPYRLSMLLAEAVDRLWLQADLIMVLVFTVESGVIITTDLSYRLGDVCDRLDALNARLARWRQGRANYPDNHVRSSEFTAADESVENDILSAQADLVDVFEHIGHCDKFMKSFAASHMLYWSGGNVTYLVVSLYTTKQTLYIGNPVLNTFMALEVLILSVTFYQMSRPFVVAVRLYSKICSTVALDPYVDKSKPAWLWILEYYHEYSSRYSLHFITKQHNLSFLTYLQCLSWCISCCLYAMNLLKHLLFL